MIERESNGRFLSGHHYSPNTQIKPGERKSIQTEFKLGERRGMRTEFKPGQTPHNKLPIGTVRIRKETNTGLFRAWVKIAEPNVWKKRAVIVWEETNGPLPKGWVVHHIDRNSLNDSPENLQGMTRRDHVNEHRQELEEAKST